MSDVESATSNDVPDQIPQALSTSSSNDPPPSSADGTIQLEPSDPVFDTTLVPMGVTRPHLSAVDNSLGNSSIVVLSTETAPQPRRSQRRLIWCIGWSRQTFLILSYPIMVVVSIIGLIMVLIFCVFPTLLFMGLVICAYYCFNPEPLPLSVLIRDLLIGEDPNRNNTSFFRNSASNGIQDPEQAKADRALYQTKLIVRRLLKVETVPPSCFGAPLSSSHCSGESKNKRQVKVIDHRSSTPKPKMGAELDADHTDEAWKRFIDKGDLREHKSPIEIWTDHRILSFSARLEPPTEDSDGDGDDDDESCHFCKFSKELPSLSGDDADDAEPIPHYQRTSEIELSSGHLRESSPPSERPDSPRLEHGQTSSDNSIHLDCDDGVSQSDSGVISTNNEAEDTTVKLREGTPADSTSDKQYDNSTKSDNANCRSVFSPNTDYFGVEDDERDPGTACDICILEFEVGDEVAWSPNLHCSHAFHKDCILDWLVRKPTCPSCRQDYVCVTSEEETV